MTDPDARVGTLDVGTDLPPQQIVRYTYWPVNYYLGDPTVISSAALPLSGVKFSCMAKGTGELKASLQVADADVRAMNPWELIVPRKTGIVAIRSARMSEDEPEVHTVEWHGMVWAAPIDETTGRMEITARSIEYCWAQRLITGPMAGGDLVFAQTDRTFIVQALLDPERFSQLGPQTETATAVATVAAATADRVWVVNADAPGFPTGAYVQVTDNTGALRVNAAGNSTVFRVTGQSVSGANTAILISPNLGNLSQVGDTLHAVKLFPGWINVDPPTLPTGKLHDFTYVRDQQTNLLEAHVDRSKVDDGYDWYTRTRVLTGADPYQASTYRVQYLMGYPRLGRQYGTDEIPRFSNFIDGRGNVISASAVYDGSDVRNAVWGQGAGYDSSALRALATNSSDWANGFVMTEGRYSNPDVSVATTLQQYTNAALIQSYSNERFLGAVTVRGDLPPYFGEYNIYDDTLYTTDGWGNPDRADGTRDVTFLSRIMGWTVTPPEGTHSETIDLVLIGGTDVG
jgi:hypothetical protein